MSEPSTLIRTPFVWLRNKFLAGLAVVIPLVVTFWILTFIYDFLHGVSKPLLENGVAVYNQATGEGMRINIEGRAFANFATFIGFLVPILVVVALGAVATNVIGARVVSAMDRLVLRIPMRRATAISLVAMILSSLAGLVGRLGTDVTLDWPLTLLFTAGSALGGLAGGPLAARARPSTLTFAFAALLAAVAAVTLINTLGGASL